MMKKIISNVQRMLVIGTVLMMAATNMLAQTCAPAPAGLVSWWSGDGNALDSRSRSDGTLQNGAGFASGYVGQAFAFDGVDDQITTSAFSGHNGGTALTIEAWLMSTTISHSQTILQKRSAANVGGYVFETTAAPFTANSLQFVIMIGGVYKVAAAPPNVLTPGVWQHVAARYDGSSMSIFVNGAQVISMPQSGAIDTSNSPIVIGRNVVNNATTQGLIDEIAVYNRALPIAEIQAIFAAGTTGKCKPTATASSFGLVSWWPGDGDSQDITGANNGSVQGNVSYIVGKSSQAFRLAGNGDTSGNSDRVVVGDPAALHLQTFKIEAWIRRANTTVVTNSAVPTSPAGTIFAYGQNGYAFLLDQATSRLALSKVGVSQIIATSLPINDTNWHHVAVSNTGNTDLRRNLCLYCQRGYRCTRR
jgi:hypothetical protein